MSAPSVAFYVSLSLKYDRMLERLMSCKRLSDCYSLEYECEQLGKRLAAMRARFPASVLQAASVPECVS